MPRNPLQTVILNGHQAEAFKVKYCEFQESNYGQKATQNYMILAAWGA